MITQTAEIVRPLTRSGEVVDAQRFDDVVKKWQAGEITARAAYKQLNIAERTFYRYLENTGLIKTRKRKRIRIARVPEEVYNRLKAAGEI